MMSYKLLISSYIVNEYGRLETDIKEAEYAIRWGNYCSHDVAHLQLLKCKFETFKDIASNIMILCKVSESDLVDYVAEIRKKEMLKKIDKERK